MLDQVAEINFWMDLITASNTADKERSEHSQLHPEVSTESNVYNFGIMLLEIISGKLPYTEEQGSIVNWVKPKSKFSSALSSFIVGSSDMK